VTRGDIVLINLPQAADGAGHEQVGTRPALVLPVGLRQDDVTSETLSVIMIVPFTSNLKAQRFPHTILIQPSARNGLSTPSVLLVFQLRAIDKKRVTKKIGYLEDELMLKVNAEMKDLLGL
jgi:mRNA interferase MazF